MHGSYEANCTEEYRGEAFSYGKRKDPAPKPKPKPGRVDRKVIIEYSSDEFDEENPQPIEGTGAPKRVV